MQEHQSIPTNVTDSEIGILMVLYENFYFTNFKCFKELRKCVAKIVLWKNIRWYGDPNYVEIFFNNIEFLETLEKLIFLIDHHFKSM